MLEMKSRKKVAAAPQQPKPFTEDFCARGDQLNSATKSRRSAHAEGSVYHHAKKLVASSAGTTDDSSLSSDVELIISELENVTQGSDASSSTQRDVSGAETECTDLQEAMRIVLERNRRLMQERTKLRKTLFAKVMEKIDAKEAAEPQAKTSIRKAILSLVSDLSVRHDFLRALDSSSAAVLCLLYTRGRVAGLYRQEGTVLVRLFGVENAPSVVREREVTRWAAWEGGKMKPGDRKHAVAFDV